MKISRRNVLIGAGVGAGALAVGGSATLLDDGLPGTPDSLLRIDALPSDDPTPGWFHTSRVRTLRRTHDNRILVRNSFTFNEDGRHKPTATAKFRKNHRLSFERRFPSLSQVPFDYTWGGGLGMTRNGNSFFGQLRDNVYGALGCNGLGTVRGTATGTLLADWLAGKSQPLTEFLLSVPKPNINPPDPFLTVGVNFTLRKGQIAAGLEA